MLVQAAPLLEREEEIAAIRGALAPTGEGRGGVIAFEAPAGLGKTRLLTTAVEHGEQAGAQVLTARGFELERQFTFGVLRQLYEPVVATAGREERDRLLEGAAAPVRSALGAGEGPAPEAIDPVFAVAHGLYWLTANVAERGPLLIALDDAHWADGASLRCLSYLAHRLHDLPAVLAVAIRTGEEGDDQLAAMLDDVAATRIKPRPLSVAATGALIAERVGEDADPAFAAAAHTLTGGTPFLVDALAADLRDEGIHPDADGAARLPALTPDAVARSVLVRLSRLGDGATELAQAVAVLGDGASLAHAAELAGLDAAEAADAADRLGRADVLRPAPSLAFTHPLVRDAIHAETPVHACAVLHAGAARLLHREGASIEHVGAHLVRTAPVGDEWVAARLAEAAAAAGSRGDLESAAAFLERALDEPPPVADRARLLHELGKAEYRLGRPGSFDHLKEAEALAEDPALAAGIMFDQARALLVTGRPEAVAALERAKAQLAREDRGHTVRQECELIILGRHYPWTAPLVSELADGLAGVVSRREPGWEFACNSLAGQAYLRNEPAAKGLGLVRQSLEALVERGGDPSESAVFIHNARGLMLGGEYEEAEHYLNIALDAARRVNAVVGFSTTAAFLADSALRRGDLVRAEEDAAMALDAARASPIQPQIQLVIGVLIWVLVERGQLDEADRLLAEHDLTGELPVSASLPGLAYARGMLREAQGRTDAALADVLATGDAVRALLVSGPSPVPWRSAAARLMAQLDRRDEARRTAAEDVELARDFGAPHTLGLALRGAALAPGGDAALRYLEESVEVLARSQARLELARSQCHLGSALRRTGRRAEARDVLRAALDGASRCGARPLAERTRAELLAAGAKPHRERTSGVAALTASERRVAELAVEGLTNRQIAQALFVTASTVEKHLASAYSKLDVAGRAELADAFTPTSR